MGGGQILHFIASAKSTIIRRPSIASQPTEIDCVNRWTEAEDDTQLAPLVVLNQLKFQTRVQESDLWQPDAMMGGKQSRQTDELSSCLRASDYSRTVSIAAWVMCGSSKSQRPKCKARSLSWGRKYSSNHEEDVSWVEERNVAQLHPTTFDKIKFSYHVILLFLLLQGNRTVPYSNK